MAEFTSKFIKILFSYDWEVIEIQGAVFKIVWGLWLLMPFDTFRAIKGYYAVGLENYWGWGLLILGMIHLYSIFSRKLLFRRWITFVAFTFWIFTIVLIWEQAHTSALLPFFAIIAFFMGLNFLRLGIQGKVDQLIDERKINLGAPDGYAERRNE